MMNIKTNLVHFSPVIHGTILASTIKANEVIRLQISSRVFKVIYTDHLEAFLGAKNIHEYTYYVLLYI